MTDRVASGFGSDLVNERLVKYQQLVEVLEGCFDLLNGDLSDDDWHRSLARLAGCRSTACLWWHEGLPENFGIGCSGELQPSPRAWVDYLEPALAAARPAGPMALEPITSNPQLLTPDRLVFCLESSPLRVVFVFTDPLDDREWDERDRRNVLRYMQIIAKPIRTRRQLSLLTDILDLTNKFLDGLPRACIVLTPDADVISSNTMAQKLLAQGDVMRIRDDKLELCDKGKNIELRRELQAVLELPKDKLATYTWHRNLSDSTEPDSCMLAMHVFPFETWRLESSTRDRVLIMAVQVQSEVAIPSVAQIREFYQLTGAQARVSVALLEGKTVEEVAEALNISVNTVRTHLRAIYSRLGVDNKSHLIARLSKTLTVPKGDSHAG